MPPQRNIKELRGLQGYQAYIHCFIENLVGKYQPFSQVMKNGVSVVWDAECKKVFNDIKQYLTNPLVLIAQVSGKPFI